MGQQIFRQKNQHLVADTGGRGIGGRIPTEPLKGDADASP